MKEKFTKQKMMQLKTYFHHYDNYLFLTNDYKEHINRINKINKLVDCMSDWKQENGITAEELRQYNLIYRVSID